MARSKATPTKRTNSPATKTTPKSAKRAPMSKQDQVIGMLKRAEGASIEDLVAKTGWQKHTVRALIAASLRKRLQLNVVREKSKTGTSIYRIAG